jgi:hypothetical protein
VDRDTDVKFYVYKPMRLAGRDFQRGDVLDLGLEAARRHAREGFGSVMGERREDDGSARLTAPPAAPSTAKVRLLKAMNLDGKNYPVGAVVRIDASTAQHLVSCSAATYETDAGSERSAEGRPGGPTAAELTELFALGRCPGDRTFEMMLPE